MLKHHNDFETVPTVGFSVETVKLRNITLNVWVRGRFCYLFAQMRRINNNNDWQDVGGQDRIRPLWRHYFVGM